MQVEALRPPFRAALWLPFFHATLLHDYYLS